MNLIAIPLQIAGKIQHLNLQWGEARGRASFIVIIGLKSPPVLIGMDIMRPLRVHIDVTHGTATPAQPDPQTIHLNATQTPIPQSAALNVTGRRHPRQESTISSLPQPLTQRRCVFLP